MPTPHHEQLPGPPGPADPVATALLAVTARTDGDVAAAEAHLRTAQRELQSAVRRQRQLLEIARLVVAGTIERAVGLALVHGAEFPYDTVLLTRMTGQQLPAEGAP